jgi:hypothetical protein
MNMRWAGNVERKREMRNSYKILFGNAIGKIQLGRPRLKWEDNIIYLRKMGWEHVEWIHLAQDRDQLQSLVPSKRSNNLWVPS